MGGSTRDSKRARWVRSGPRAPAESGTRANVVTGSLLRVGRPLHTLLPLSSWGASVAGRRGGDHANAAWRGMAWQGKEEPQAPGEPAALGRLSLSWQNTAMEWARTGQKPLH